MRTAYAPQVVAVLLISYSAAASAQRVIDPAIAPASLADPVKRLQRADTRRLNSPEVLHATVSSTSSAIGGGLVGALTGVVLGYPSCSSNVREESWDLISCLFWNKGLIYGLYTGTFAGAGLGAGGVAIGAGCLPREAWKRSFLGSLAGTLPSLAYLAVGGSGSKDVRSAVAVGTPILQITGATTAVSQCRVLKRR